MTKDNDGQPTKHWNPPLTETPNAPPERAKPKAPVHWTGEPPVIQKPKNKTDV